MIDSAKQKFKLSKLPPSEEIETKRVFRELAQAHRFLAELKGVAQTIPNQTILLNTLPLLEAKDSSAIENIITTHDELYKQELFDDLIKNPRAKEVSNYRTALRKGFELTQKDGLLTNNHLIEIHGLLESSETGFRKIPGTGLKNQQTGEIVYTPPQDPVEILELMGNLEKFINDDSMSELDPLVKMAIIHYQFESIHPFYDGNGRIGRIINILYLVLKGYLDIPVLYLSRYIIKNKAEYYRLLQETRDNEKLEEWVLYILKGIQETAKETISIIQQIRELMQDYKHRIRENHKFYSQDLLNNLFSHPYTKIEFIAQDLRITRQTASKYLDELSQNGLLHKEKVGNQNFYINEQLMRVFTEAE